MAPNKKRNAGRQLLITINRLRAEEDTAKIASLKRREASLLLELGQVDQAVASASALAEKENATEGDIAFLADILASAGKWRVAEEKFTEAHQLCTKAGKAEKAYKLAAGPLYLLAEARKDYRRCIEIAPSELLARRSRRLAGEEVGEADIPALSPWRELYQLEEVHLGGDPQALLGILDRWKAGEAEWRWRILFEGAGLSVNSDIPAGQWKKYLRQTGSRVVDPRYNAERKLLKKLLRQGFVKNPGR